MVTRGTACIWAVGLGLVAGSLGVPPHADARPLHRVHGYMFVKGYFDDNVFSYSDADRQIFDSGTATSDKFPISSLSDYVTTLALRGDYDWGIRRHSLWKLRLMADGTVYARNSDRNSLGLGLALRRSLSHSDAELSVNYTPSYYLRNLYWRPMPERPTGVRYAPARYSRVVVKARTQTRLTRKVDGVFEAAVANRNYRFPFDERDNNTYSGAAGVELSLSRRLRGICLGKLDLSRARGANAADSSVEDVSNNAFGIELGASYRMSRKVTASESVEYSHQTYTTDNVMDAAHFARRDHDIAATSRVRVTLENGWQPQVFFTYHDSRSNTPAGVADFGQYTRYRMGLQMTRYF